MFDAAFFDGTHFATSAGRLGPLGPSTTYFDGCYFDPTYFDASDCSPADTGGGRGGRRVVRRPLTEDPDELLALI
jgi:hypothetical protein